MKRFLLIAACAFSGCAAQIKTVTVTKPCVVSAAPALTDANRLLVARVAPMGEDLLALVVDKASVKRFADWVDATLTWEKGVQDRCSVK